MNRLFEIQTLSDNASALTLRSYTRLSDPVSIITGGLAVINQLFPNLFGGNRRPLTQADWLKLFPSSGYWTTLLREHLANTIHYDVDLSNIPAYTRYFVDDHLTQLCGGGCSREQGLQILSDHLKEETRTGGGNSPFPYPGSSINWQNILLIGGGAILVLTLLNKKKK